MGYAKLREGEGTWADNDLRDLEGNPITWSEHIPEIVMVTCFDSSGTGLYVLTIDEDTYFTCHSIVLEFYEDDDVKPCDDCGTLIFADVHDAEMGMCLKCSDDYFGGDNNE